MTNKMKILVLAVAVECAEALEVVLPQVLQHVGVCVHRGVVISMGVLGRAEEQVAVRRKENVPGVVRLGGVRGAEERDQLRGAHSLLFILCGTGCVKTQILLHGGTEASVKMM